MRASEEIRDELALIAPERWERIAAMIPSEGRAARTQPTSRDWLLQGVATCGHCGESLYTRADRGTYACKAVRESRGTCEARPIPAEQAEQLVLDHLGDFVGGLEEWLAGRARETIHDREKFAKTLEDQRRELRNLDHRAQKAEEQYERLLDRGDAELADAALDQPLRQSDSPPP